MVLENYSLLIHSAHGTVYSESIRLTYATSDCSTEHMPTIFIPRRQKRGFGCKFNVAVYLSVLGYLPNDKTDIILFFRVIVFGKVTPSVLSLV